MKRLSLRWSTAVLVLLGAAPSAFAEEEVKIGAIYPLTGAAASSGLEMKNALELAAEMINNGAQGLNLPLSGSAGLPNLKGAKIRLVFGDHQGNPQVGATEAERLITQEKVVALIGCYASNVTATASQVAERYHVPFLTAESSSATLTQRKFKWFFRTTPHDELFVQNFFEFLRAMEKKKGIKPKRIALMNENTLWGTETTKLEEKLAKEQGYNIVEKVIYPAKSTQLTSEVQRLKAARPDLLLQSSYLGDAVLSIKSYQELGLLPEAILANDAGFNDSEFLKTLGKAANYILSREVWALDLTSRNPLIKQVNDIFLKRFKSNFNGNTARSFTGLYTLADAINRAASTEPEAIRKALAETNIAADKLIMPWGGIRFDASGQNTLGSGIIVQALDGKYVTVWPFELASKDVVWPIPAWDKR